MMMAGVGSVGAGGSDAEITRPEPHLETPTDRLAVIGITDINIRVGGRLHPLAWPGRRLLSGLMLMLRGGGTGEEQGTEQGEGGAHRAHLLGCWGAGAPS